jgi:hypothetical protein
MLVARGFDWRRIVLVGVFSIIADVAPATMIVRSYEPSRHDRFYSGGDKAFVAEDYDLSGVGRSGVYWAALISDSYFLSANHSDYHPHVGSSVTFWETNNPLGASHSYTVAGGQRIGNTDLWVGWFDEVVHSSIARYSVLDLANESDYLGRDLYNYGKNHRVGRNIGDVIADYTEGLATGRTIWFDYDNDDNPSVGGDETYIQVGDSGSSTFIVYDGELTLLGIHWSITSSTNSEGESSIDSFVPRYIDEINAVLAAKGQSLDVVPEPCSVVLAAIGLLGLAVYFRRRSR